MTFQAPKGVAEYLPPCASDTALPCERPPAGRYDGLPEEIGGPPLPGIGFAVGLDRIVLAVEAERSATARSAAAGCQVFGVALGDDAHADVFALITSLRRAEVRADMASGARGLKGAMKAADGSGANDALLIGAEERHRGTVRIKDLASGDQRDVAVTSATDWLVERLATEGQRDEP